MNNSKKTKIKSIASMAADAERKGIKKSTVTTSPPSLKDTLESIKSTRFGLTVDQVANGSLYHSGSGEDQMAKIQEHAKQTLFPDLKDTVNSMSLNNVSKLINAGSLERSGIDAINKELSKCADLFKTRQSEIQSAMHSALFSVSKSISEQLKEQRSNSLETINSLFKEQTRKSLESSIIKLVESPYLGKWRETSKRAKRLLAIFKQAEEEEFNLHGAIESELQENGALNAEQLLWFFVELGGVDTSQMAEKLGKAGGIAKKGYKSDIRLALEQVVTIINDASYEAVRRYLSKSENWSNLDSIQVEICDLPTKSNGSGELKYNDSKDKTLTIKYGGVEKHLKDIRKTLDK